MKLEQAWYATTGQQPVWIYLLWPLMALFGLLSLIRRLLFRVKLLKQYNSALPVLVVGNISVGGNGKTPVVLALLHYFEQRGIACAVLSRGYGGTQREFPYMLESGDAASRVGDEPALIKARAQVPVVIDPKRARGAQFIEQATSAQVIICDDGMQHYALARDLEICVMDKRGLGNGRLLPMGPLRESRKRLNTVDWILYNGDTPSDIMQQSILKQLEVTSSLMQLVPMMWVNVKNGEHLSIADGVEQFSQNSIAAMAGIGDPKRFFDTLSTLGLALCEHKALPDHHAIEQSDIPKADSILMTEKDAVKCAGFAKENYWYLQVTARLDQSFYDFIEQHLAIKKVIKKAAAKIQNSADDLHTKRTSKAADDL